MLNSRGSLSALKANYLEARFNLKATLLYIFNFYFNKKVHTYSKLNVGCGRDRKQGFCNIDIGKHGDLFLDVRNRLPFKDSSIDYIYSSHFLEHLSHKDIISHLKESYRILKSNGVYRIVIPDFMRSLRAYVNNDNDWFKFLAEKFPLEISKLDGLRSDELCQMDYLNIALHEYGGEHKICLDFEKVQRLLVHSGFKKSNISLSSFDESIDRLVRKDFSIYIEASK